jgi:hypothetical protein
VSNTEADDGARSGGCGYESTAHSHPEARRLPPGRQAVVDERIERIRRVMDHIW